MKAGDRPKRPGTSTRGFGLFALVVILASVPVFGWIKGRPPMTLYAAHGFAQKAVEFSLQDLEGKTQSLAAHKGKGLFLYFFNPRFHACLPDLEKINKVYKDNLERRSSFEFIGICAGCSRETAESVANENRILFPLCPDPDFAATKAYGAAALPLSLVVATWRTVKFEHVGAIPNMQELFEGSFQEYLGLRLGIWRYRYGSEEERKEFEEKLTPEQKIKRVDRDDETISRIAKQVSCLCDSQKNLEDCPCDRHYQKALYTWMNFFLQDGSLTEKQIVQVLNWKAEGLKRKFADEKQEGKP